MESEAERDLYVEIDRLAWFWAKRNAGFDEGLEIVDEPWGGIKPGRYVRLTPDRLVKLARRHGPAKRSDLFRVAMAAANAGIVAADVFPEIDAATRTRTDF